MKVLTIRSKQKTSTKHQQGATLITVMIFLIIMTLVGVSSSKIAIQDIMVASSDQQQVEVFIGTENELKKLSTVTELYAPLVGENGAEFDEDTCKYKAPGDSYLDRVITDKGKFPCGGFNGAAVSLGPNTSECEVFDFYIKTSRSNSGAKDKHNRGAGKEIPDASRNSFLGSTPLNECSQK